MLVYGGLFDGVKLVESMIHFHVLIRVVFLGFRPVGKSCLLLLVCYRM